MIILFAADQNFFFVLKGFVERNDFAQERGRVNVQGQDGNWCRAVRPKDRSRQIERERKATIPAFDDVKIRRQAAGPEQCALNQLFIFRQSVTDVSRNLEQCLANRGKQTDLVIGIGADQPLKPVSQVIFESRVVRAAGILKNGFIQERVSLQYGGIAQSLVQPQTEQVGSFGRHICQMLRHFAVK
ncbi:hypothetical protein [Insolitispirillum peregrinum]|uniref:hypothetical protein n=1 Tax=Insolitispirillum peregrinum TaxID=80876 RepID=UPI00158A7139|nr:hypothetical protein [Insolitispirillum peregrinum]